MVPCDLLLVIPLIAHDPMLALTSLLSPVWWLIATRNVDVAISTTLQLCSSIDSVVVYLYFESVQEWAKAFPRVSSGWLSRVIASLLRFLVFPSPVAINTLWEMTVSSTITVPKSLIAQCSTSRVHFARHWSSLTLIVSNNRILWSSSMCHYVRLSHFSKFISRSSIENPIFYPKDWRLRPWRMYRMVILQPYKTCCHSYGVPCYNPPPFESFDYSVDEPLKRCGTLLIFLTWTPHKMDPICHHPRVNVLIVYLLVISVRLLASQSRNGNPCSLDTHSEYISLTAMLPFSDHKIKYYT